MTIKKFPYGDQFDTKKFKLSEILNICQKNSGCENDIVQAMANKYWNSNINMAKNTLHSLKDYKLIDNKTFQLTPIANEILRKTNESEMNILFSKHILSDINGLLFIKLIDTMYIRGDELKNESIIKELNRLGYGINPSSTYINTMKNWLHLGGVFKNTKWESIDWSIVEKLLDGKRDTLDSLTNITLIQKNFLRSLYALNSKDFILSNKVKSHSETFYNTDFPSKTFSAKVLQPLEKLGLIEIDITSKGGPNKVKLTKNVNNDLSKQYLDQTSNLVNIEIALLNKSYEEIYNDLKSTDNYIKGQALELLSLFLVRYANLKFNNWRLRSNETGYAEIDLIAFQTTLGFHKWQIQCKNCDKVELEVISKEVGHTYLTKADTLLFITTGRFTNKAIQYGHKIIRETHLTLFFINGKDLDMLKADYSHITHILKSQTEFITRLKSI